MKAYVLRFCFYGRRGEDFWEKIKFLSLSAFRGQTKHALPSQNLLNSNGKIQGLILCMIWIPPSSSPALAPCSPTAYKLLSKLSAFPQFQYIMAMIYLNSIPIEEKEKMESTEKSVIRCSYQILPGRHGEYSQPVSKVLSLWEELSCRSCSRHSDFIIWEILLFHYLWDTTEADEGTHSALGSA